MLSNVSLGQLSVDFMLNVSLPHIIKLSCKNRRNQILFAWTGLLYHKYSSVWGILVLI